MGLPRSLTSRLDGGRRDHRDSPWSCDSPWRRLGLVTAVPGYASSITYHPSGLANAITHTNSVVVTYAEDPDAMARPRGCRWGSPSASFRRRPTCSG